MQFNFKNFVYSSIIFIIIAIILKYIFQYIFDTSLDVFSLLWWAWGFISIGVSELIDIKFKLRWFTRC